MLSDQSINPRLSKHDLRDRLSEARCAGTYPLEMPEPVAKTGVAIEALMAALLFFTPLAYGTTEAWSQEMFIAIVTALVACLALRFAVDSTSKVVRSWAYLPIVLFIAFGALQLLPLPASAIHAVSPGTILTKSTLLSDLDRASAVLQRLTVTFYSAGSIEQLRLVVAVSAIFVVVMNYYRDSARISRLLLTIACVGLAVALLAFYQNLTHAETVYGLVPAIQKNSGPFMCYSHFAQFMNLSVGAAFGLLLVRLIELGKRHRHIVGVVEELKQPSSWLIWLLAAICVLGPMAVFLSLARVGMISLLIAGGVTGAMFTWRSRTAGRGSLVIGIGIIMFAGLLSVGFDAIYARLATMRHVAIADGGRLQMLHDMFAEFKLFPVVGTGLGTHEFVFPMFDHSHIPSLATHAEDEYAQLFEECGIVGIALAGLFLGGVIINYFRTVWRPLQPIQYAGFGLGLGLLAILIHSTSDFGQHLPANAAITAVFAALLVNLAKSSQGNPRSTPTLSASRLWTINPRTLQTAIFATGILVLSATLWSADRSRRAESLWNRAAAVQAGLEQNGWQGTNDEFVDLLSPASAAADLEPGNVTYRYWLNVFRWRAISRVTDPATQAVVLTPSSIAFAGRISEELEQARLLCPTFGPPLCVAGQLEQFVLNRPIGARHIALAFRLTPYDRTVCFIAGKLAVQQKDWDQSLEAFRRCAGLGGFDQEILLAYIHANRPDLALEIARGNRRDLSYLAEQIQGKPGDEQLSARCRQEVNAQLVAEAGQANASPGDLADLAANYAQQGDFAQAIVWYRKAVDFDYGQVDWRLHLASLLAEHGHVSEAMEQAKICIRLRPQSNEARKLIGDLSVRDANEKWDDPTGTDLAATAGVTASPAH